MWKAGWKRSAASGDQEVSEDNEFIGSRDLASRFSWRVSSEAMRHMRKEYDTLSLCLQSCAVKMQFHFLTQPVTFKRDCMPSLCSRAGGCLSKRTVRVGAFALFIHKSVLLVLLPSWSWEPERAWGPAQSLHYPNCPHGGNVALVSRCFPPGCVEGHCRFTA